VTPFCEKLALTLTPTALASALMSLATIAPRFESLSLPRRGHAGGGGGGGRAGIDQSGAQCHALCVPAIASETLTASASAFTPAGDAPLSLIEEIVVARASIQSRCSGAGVLSLFARLRRRRRLLC